MTREQERASLAFQHVSETAEDANIDSRRYATVVYQLIVLVRTAGLVQALEFLAALSNDAKRAAAERLLDQLAIQMQRVHANLAGGEALRDFAREVGLQTYMLLTRELMATMVWYRRFVQSVLKLDAADVLQDNDE